MQCSTCEIIVADESEAVFERGYWWHRACFRGGFPAAGKLIPPTIVTVFPEPAEMPSPRRRSRTVEPAKPDTRYENCFFNSLRQK